MATLDNAVWLTASDGTAESNAVTITDGAYSTVVTGTFSTNAWDASQSGYAVSEFGAFGITSAISANYDFSNPVEDLNFSLNHLNSQGSTYDDQFTIYAYDENGALLDSADVIAAMSGLDQDIYWVNGDGSVTVEGEGSNSNNVAFDLPGQISRLMIVYDVGEDGVQTGGAGISDLSFTIPPVLDDIVEGTAGNDLITDAYLGDPDGDRVDNNDSTGAETGNPGSNDDVIHAGAGNDTIYAGAGSDEVLGGADNDLIFGGGGADSLFGQDGNDTINGGGGADTISGGAGDDILEGNNGADILDGDGGDDRFYLSGTFGDDQIDGGNSDETSGDTLDLSNLTQDTTVDLTAANAESGSVSDGTSTASFDEIENIILGGGRDTITLADGGGADAVQAFDMTNSGDGSTNDQLDVSAMTSDGGTTPVGWRDVVVSDTNGDGSGDAILTFPGGESITLVGVLPSEVDSGAELMSIGIPCFTPGTMILTAHGEVAIEALSVGDLIWTVDNGLQPLRWIGRRHLTQTDLGVAPELRPVRIKTGTFGNRREMLVSPQHGMVISAGEETMLIRAKHAAKFMGADVALVDRHAEQVTYYHLMFDCHQLIWAEGAQTESFYPGKMALSALERDTLKELLTLFPELAQTFARRSGKNIYGAPARDYLNQSDAKIHAAAMLI